LKIARSVEALPAYKRAKTIMFYMNKGSEVPTTGMISKALKNGKAVLIPFIAKNAEGIKAARILSLRRGLVKGAYGITEPAPRFCRAVPEKMIDLVIVPAVAYDKKCRRIGYGGGYYDRWLEKIPMGARVGIAFDRQIVNELPQYPGDKRVGTVVTEKRLVRRVGRSF
jgi:5-formyltetrahydrofolate cyclo-ligase